MEAPSHDNSNGSENRRIRLSRTIAKVGHRPIAKVGHRAIAKVGHCAIAKVGHRKGKRGHPKVKSLVSTIVFSLTKESLQYLKGPEGEDAMADITTHLAHTFSRLMVSEYARHAIRITAEEATTGFCEGVAFKAKELATKVPRFALVKASLLVGAYAALLALGLLLCFWRFSIYGKAGPTLGGQP